MPGHARSRLARAARFHLTSIGGIIDTFTVAATVHYVFKVAAFLAQAIALLLAILRTVFAGLLLYPARA
jgi:hypothetical protein